MNLIKAKIASVIFYSPDTFYSILNVIVNDKPEKLQGTIYSPFPLQEIEFSGEKIHSSYGEQYKAEQIIPKLPLLEDEIVSCLSGEAFPRLGPATGKKIVKMVGVDNFWEKITPDIKYNLIVNKINHDVSNHFYSMVEKYKSHIRLIPLLSEAGFPAYKINSIIAAFGANTEETLKTNPYLLLQKVEGLSFSLIDNLAAKYNLSRISGARVNAGIMEVLKEYNKTSGDTGLEFNALFEMATKFLDVDQAVVFAQLNGLIDDKNLIEEKIDSYTFIFLPSIYYTELGIKSNIERLNTPSSTTHTALLNNLSINLSPDQKNAINKMINEKVVILTGMPGSGKTTIIKYALSEFRRLHPKAKFALSAPTGKAASRMEESTNMPAQTNHRLLGCDQAGKFAFNEANNLNLDLLILDECSMIDIYLFYAILRALPARCRLWMVGDNNQLPPVNCGAPFRDLINSKKITHLHLDTVFRQSANSHILANAKSLLLKSGVASANSQDFCFLSKDSEEDTLARLIDLYIKDIPHTRSISIEKIQILVPQRTGTLGTQNLNFLIQKRIQSDNQKKIKWLENTFFTNDKVIQIKNNYDKDVYNGDIGKIIKINNKNFSLTVAFGTRHIEYVKSEIEELALAYALTIHKYQGSEAECILFPVSKQHFKMLTPKLLYTGLTRARSLLVLIGSKNLLNYANQTNSDVERFSMLNYFLNNPSFFG